MADTLVFDMSEQSEGSPSVFTKKDWLSILDNQNGNYNGNQCVIDTSQLANSNKFMNYREGYLFVPMLMTATALGNGTAAVPCAFANQNCSNMFGMKNWYGSIVHSLTVDYNGTTIVQQTPYIGLWNSFKLMTSLSFEDLKTQGDLIGFYPDTARACGVSQATSGYASGTGPTIFNNQVLPYVQPNLNGGGGVCSSHATTNMGLYKRQEAWNLQLNDKAMNGTLTNTIGTISSTQTWNQMYKSYIFNKITTVIGAGPGYATTTPGVFQAQIGAIIYLKHLHAFFERICLLKGVFLKLTLNLNQSSTTFSTVSNAGVLAFTGATSVQSPLGGVSPLMVASLQAPITNVLDAGDPSPNLGGAGDIGVGVFTLSLSVGKKCLNSAQTALGGGVQESPGVGSSVILNIPAYSFNPVFETSYLSTPVKKVIYSDVYQYQGLNIGSNSPFNNLITNGIANIKSVLVLPFFNSASNGGLIPFQSPFDPAGGGPTSPMCLLNQFNIQISGQNAIYNTERFTYEQFANQFKGVNAVNGGQIDGLVSGLIGQSDFDNEYCYYYVNCGRMLPVEEAVPKSVNILGINTSLLAVDLYLFVEYGVEVNLDILTGARV